MVKLINLSFIIPLTLLFFASYVGYQNLKEITFYEKNTSSEQVEINVEKFKKEIVLKPNGKLNFIGWARRQEGFEMNPDFIKPSTSLFNFLNPYRYKKWEFYLFTSKDAIFAFAVVDVTIAKGYFIHYYDKKTDRIVKKDSFTPFENAEITENCYFNCNSGKYNTVNNDIFIDINKTELNNHKIRFLYTDGNISFDIDVLAAPPKKMSDHYVGLTPISEDTTLFFFTNKSNCLMPKGKIKINNEEKLDSDFMLSYDSGRGVWPIRSGWVWASGNGRTTGGDIFGVNIGHGFSHPTSSKHTEDIFFVNGKGFKLNSVISDLPKNLFDEFLRAEDQYIRFYTESGENSCDLEFKTNKILVSNKSILYIANVKFTLSYGYFTGVCKAGNETFELKDVYGLIEFNSNIW